MLKFTVSLCALLCVALTGFANENDHKSPAESQVIEKQIQALVAANDDNLEQFPTIEDKLLAGDCGCAKKGRDKNLSSCCGEEEMTTEENCGTAKVACGKCGGGKHFAATVAAEDEVVVEKTPVVIEA